MPEHCVIAAIIRKGEVMIPRGITTIEEDDEILAVTDAEGAKELAELFSTARRQDQDTANGHTWRYGIGQGEFGNLEPSETVV